MAALGAVGTNITRAAIAAGYDLIHSDSGGPAAHAHLVNKLGSLVSVTSSTMQAFATPIAALVTLAPIARELGANRASGRKKGRGDLEGCVSASRLSLSRQAVARQRASDCAAGGRAAFRVSPASRDPNHLPTLS